MAQSAAAAVVISLGKATVVEVQTISATVTGIMSETREVTLKGPKGNEVTVIAGPAVKNFGKINVGDTVAAKSIETLTLELIKGGAGSPIRVDDEVEAKAAEGESPAVAVSSQTTVIADVVKVDRAAGTVEVKGVVESMTLKIDDPEQLQQIEVGDRVKGVILSALAIEVVPS